jgi:hypothetical protein
MFKEQKTNTVVLGLVVILGILWASSVAEAALDIEWVWIMTELEHVDGVAGAWDFEIEVFVSDPGLLHHIDVIKPGDTTPSHTLYESEPDRWIFDPPKHPSLPALRADYPEGTYTLEFRDSGNTLLKTVSLDYSGLSDPTGISAVDFTYPSVNGQTGVIVDPPFNWTIPPAATDWDVLALGVDDAATGDQVYGAWPVSRTVFWKPAGLLLPSHEYELDVSVSRVKDWVGPGMPTMTVEGDEFAYILTFDYQNEIEFTAAPTPGTLSGLVFIPPDVPDIGYSLDKGDLLYFYSSEPVLNYNITDGEWNTEGPKGWIYVQWPFVYELGTGDLWFAWPPESGLWVYYFNAGQWIVLPRIILW